MTNLKFLHFPVAAKAVLLIAALGLLSIAANWFCLERLDEIDRLNATVTRHLAPARLALAEAKAASESFGVAVYKGYSASDPDQVKESVEEIEGQYNAARRALNNVLAAYPAASDDVHRMFEKLELAHAIAAEIGRSVSSGQTQQAERLVNFKFDPARDDVTGHMDRLINILGAKARSTEAEVAAYGATTYRTTIAILGGGTAAALLVAFLLTQYFITRPLRRMARAMSLMAGGDLAVPVAGDRRAATKSAPWHGRWLCFATTPWRCATPSDHAPPSGRARRRKNPPRWKRSRMRSSVKSWPSPTPLDMPPQSSNRSRAA
jgi:methyl-accepting chemotaxis protein